MAQLTSQPIAARLDLGERVIPRGTINMKKKAIVAVTLCVVMLICVSCASQTPSHPPNNQPTQKVSPQQSPTSTPGGVAEMNHIPTYEIKRDVFYEFIENPSLAVLQQAERGTHSSVLMKSDTAGIILRESHGVEPPRVYEHKSGALRLLNNNLFIVHESLLDFFCNRKVLEEFLHRNGVEGEVSEFALLAHISTPLTVWMVINQENYFITLDDESNDYADWDKTTYTYRLYTHSKYLNKFGMKDGQLFVNGVDITGENYVKFHFEYAEVPILPIIYALGAVVVETDGIYHITYNGEDFIYDPEGDLFQRGDDAQSNALQPVGGGYRFRTFVDGVPIMDSFSVRSVLRLLGAGIAVNHETLRIDVF